MRPPPGGTRALRSAPSTQIPETASVGTALSTFTCEDPDSPGVTLRYELRAHSPRGLASLRLRDRVLEVPARPPGCSGGAGAGVPGGVRGRQGMWGPPTRLQRSQAGPLHPSRQVNATLDCDAPGGCFQLPASLLVLDGGQPPLSSE